MTRQEHLASALAVICLGAAFVTHAGETERGEHHPGLVLSIGEIRIGDQERGGTYLAEFQIFLTNVSDEACCILPSDLVKCAIFRCSDGQRLVGLQHRSTYYHDVGSIEELNLTALHIPPREEATTRLVIPVDNTLRRGSGSLYILIKCLPFRNAASYRGVTIYRRELSTRLDFAGTWNAASRQWILRPVPKERKDESRGLGPGVCRNLGGRHGGACLLVRL